MTKKMIVVGLLVALFAGVAAAVVIAAPVDDQYANAVAEETPPAVATQAGVAGTTTGEAGTTTGETVTGAATTTEPTTTGATTTEATTTTAGNAPSAPSGPNTPSAAGEAPATESSQLPFTGIALGLIVAGGLAAAGTGLVLRRVSRSRRS